VTREELKVRLIRPIARELADGAQDRVVAGGLERLIAALAQPFPEVQRVLAGYRQMDTETRKARLQKALELLGEQVPQNRPQRSVSSPSPTPRAISFDTPIEALNLGAGGKKKTGRAGHPGPARSAAPLPPPLRGPSHPPKHPRGGGRG
jgi:ATP-dependent DNA helicase RecG